MFMKCYFYLFRQLFTVSVRMFSRLEDQRMGIFTLINDGYKIRDKNWL